jgi:tetratricopeptide (TPR) repeat protein
LALASGKKGEYGDGFIQLMRALAKGPNLIEGHHGLAVAYFRAGNFERAISEWNKVLSLFPGIAGIHFNLGNAYRKMGLLRDAVSAYRKAVQIKPTYAKAHNNLAILYSATAHYDLGRRHLKIAEALGYPVHPNLQGLFRRMLRERPRGSPLS